MSTIVEAREEVTTADRVADAVRGVAHASQNARLFKSLAEDAIETGFHAARRSLRRRMRELEDLNDDAVRRIRRRPLAAVGSAVAVGVALGLAAGWLARRSRCHS